MTGDADLTVKAAVPDECKKTKPAEEETGIGRPAEDAAKRRTQTIVTIAVLIGVE